MHVSVTERNTLEGIKVQFANTSRGSRVTHPRQLERVEHLRDTIHQLVTRAAADSGVPAGPNISPLYTMSFSACRVTIPSDINFR